MFGFVKESRKFKKKKKTEEQTAIRNSYFKLSGEENKNINYLC